MKARLLTFVALLLGLVACQTDPVGLDVTLGEGVESVITVTLSDATRGDSAEGGLGNITLGEQYSLRYILEIYAVDEEGEAITTSCQRHIKVANTTSVAFPVRLAPGYDYQFAVWADFVEKDSDGSDRYYKTTDGDKSFGLYALTIDETKWNPMDETRDAFTASELICNFSSASTITLNLERPFAKLRVVATDIEAIKAVGLKPKTATLSYQADIPLSYNVVTRNVVTNAYLNSNKIHTIDYTNCTSAYEDEVAKERTLFTDYIFVPSKGTVQFTLNIYRDAAHKELIKSNSFPTEIAIAGNQLTTIKGDLLTVGSKVEVEVTEEAGTTLEHYVAVKDTEELKEAFEKAKAGDKTNIVLKNDTEVTERIYIGARAGEGTDIYLNLDGKKITADETLGSDCLLYVREGNSLTIGGNGTIEAETPAAILFCPYGDLIIENGTFIRHIPEGYTGSVTSMFVGTKPDGGWESTGVTIKGGYFDSGYYNANAADIEELLAGTKTLVESEDDIKKRGNSGDANPTRMALKNNCMKMFNRSNNYFHIYGGTFVGANPAWGDEGCMLPTKPQYLRPWSYYQGALLDGQEFNENGIVLPEGYTITKGTHEDGRPTYTVNYTPLTTQE